LAYTQIIATLKARAHDAGLEVITRNPAYTSVIGRAKFAERYGLGVHHAAALVIARRALNLSERPNRRARTARALPAESSAARLVVLEPGRPSTATHAACGRSVFGPIPVTPDPKGDGVTGDPFARGWRNSNPRIVSNTVRLKCMECFPWLEAR